MSKLIVTGNGVVFGPFRQFVELGDRYVADGCDYPFGECQVIECDLPAGFRASLYRYEEGQGLVERDDSVSSVPVPLQVTMRQARLALLADGVLPAVNAAVANMPGVQGDMARIEWEFSSEVYRYRPLVLALAQLLGWDNAKLDALFIHAATL